MGVEDLAMVFQGILESLRVKEQESIKSAWGIYLPKKIQRQCSAQQSPLHFSAYRHDPPCQRQTPRWPHKDRQPGMPVRQRTSRKKVPRSSACLPVPLSHNMP